MADCLDILVAEDDPCIAAMLADILDDLGHRVVAVVDTAERAIDFAVGKAVDVAVIDVWLAGGSNGLTAARHLTDRNGIPVIVCSGHAAAQDARAAGAVAFLEKPFRITDLERALELAMEAGALSGAAAVAAKARMAAALAPPPAGR
ncbi:response regulator [Azospirillum sp. YIM B02556]|uniref:Response regulator n=1 Tax=Azospirillum endophyticum TaxID=2800326 RepID=A0ABS1F9T8_9PROT|nr:response regulator [Azospirillum endophyticum]MBK1840186.1 response regulator [Azospirillum endophyticum]